MIPTVIIKHGIVPIDVEKELEKLKLEEEWRYPNYSIDEICQNIGKCPGDQTRFAFSYISLN